MKREQKNKSVLEKVETVLALHRAKNPGTRLSVNSLARQAGVSRANLYVSHSNFLEKLNAAHAKKGAKEQRCLDTPEVRLRKENAELKRINKALLFLNIELRQEIARLNRRVSEKQSWKSRPESPRNM
jgi:hypothetical protein